MKRIILSLLFIITLFQPHAATNSFASDEQEVYAQILEGAILHNLALTPICSLPATYFVVINGQPQGDFYPVSYSDLSGFIDKNYLEIVDYEPKYKFHSAYFTAKNDTFPTNIRTLPTIDATVCGTIPLDQKAVLFGAIQGDELIPSLGTMWYYVRFNDVYGYAYTGHGTATSIPPNIIEKIVKPLDLSPEPKSPDQILLYALLLAIPSAIVMFSLFSRKKSPQS